MKQTLNIHRCNINLSITLIACLILTLTLIKYTCAMANPDQEHESSYQPKMVTGPLYKLSGKLLIELNKQNEQHDNVIMSPLSIQQALSMVLLGANAKSQTKQELQDSIGYGNMSESEIQQCHEEYGKIMTEFERITKIERQQPYGGSPRSTVLDMFTTVVTKNKGKVKPDYESDIRKYFHASIGNIDDEKPETKTELLDKMNNWAKKAGFGGPILVRDYLDDPFEALLLTAIRVEAFWMRQFEEIERREIFYNYGAKDKPVDGKCLKVSSINGSSLLEFTTKERARVKSLHEHMSHNATFEQLSRLNFRAVNIPLEEGLSFAVFEPIVDSYAPDGSSLPEQTTIAQLNQLIDDLFADNDHDRSRTNLAKAFELLDLTGNDNELDSFRMPKFNFESDINLKRALESIGLKRAFDEKSSEISNMMETTLYIKDIKHKAMIEATKAGIKAAAITIVKMSNCTSMMASVGRINVIIDNPFMFVLRYKKIPIFVGQLTHL